MIETKIGEQNKVAVQAIPDRYAKINKRRDTTIKKGCLKRKKLIPKVKNGFLYT